MSFNLYFAGWGSKGADEYLRSKKAHRLLSWVNETRVLDWWINDNLSHRLFIDSGAYSVAHSNIKISVDDYIEFINNHKDIKVWAELDSIPFPKLTQQTTKFSCEKSWENYVYMRDKIPYDISILPVYHFGEPKSALLNILNTKVNGKKIDYIGIGGKHGVSTDLQIQYFNEIFTIIQNSNNPNVKVHGFGITIPKILNQFPFYSADSTTWLQVAISGGILTEDLRTIQISDGSRHMKDNIQNMNKSVLDTILPTIEKYGYTYEELCSDYKKRLLYNIDVMLNWESNYKYIGPETFKSHKLF